jgi:valyl-tRNA synthetase
VARLANEHIEKFRYHEAANVLYQFFWHEFCDWYVELKKPAFTEGSGLTPEWRNMLAAMERALRLLHPLTPFITEELWQRLATNTAERPKSLALAAYPQYSPELADAEAERKVEALQNAITAVRTLKAELGIDPKAALAGTFFGHTDEASAVIEEQAEAVRRLANAELKVVRGKAPEGQAMHHETAFDLVLELPEGETKALRERLEKQLQHLTKARDSSKRQLGNEEFLSKAPPNVIESIRAKLADYESQIERISGTLRLLP